MQTTVANLRRIKEFAREAGVTVRALHLYDRLDLLKPAALSEAGYRLYGEAELERLEQILALRFVGFSLEQIKELLRGPTRPLVTALRMQRELIARRKRRLESAIAAIDEAERALSRDESADVWKTLHTVIEVFKVQNDWEWTKKYYSEEAIEQLEERLRDTSKELIEQGQRAWTALLAEVEEAASRGLDPSSDTARELARRWSELLAQFTQGSAAIAQGLNRLWSDPTHWPSDFTRPWSDAAEAFIKKAMNCHSQHKESGAVDRD
jgi:MerR family transcriptional regulator, thiopeptide resistance regulator